MKNLIVAVAMALAAGAIPAQTITSSVSGGTGSYTVINGVNQSSGNVTYNIDEDVDYYVPVFSWFGWFKFWR